MKNEFKAHPLMLLKFIKPFLFVLIIPVIKGIVQYILKGKITGVLTLEIIAFSLILLIGFLRLKAFRLILYDRKIRVVNGFLIKKSAEIETDKISSAVAVKGIFDVFFGAVTFHLNTEAGRQGKPDFEFKLSKKDAVAAVQLLYKTEHKMTVKYSFKRVVLSSALCSSSIMGIILGIPLLNQTGKMLGVALSEMLFDTINETANRINTYFPPVFNIITLVLLTGYGFSFIFTLFKYFNFKLLSGNKHLEIQHGLIIKKKILFNRESINDICVEQTPLMRLVNRFSVRASVGGFGDEKAERALLVPIAKKKEINRKLFFGFHNFNSDAPIIRPMQSKKMFWRFVSIPLNIAVFTIAAGIFAKLYIPFFDNLAVFITAVILVFDLYYGTLRMFNYSHGKLQLGDFITASGTYGFDTRELNCPKEKIGFIKLSQHPYDKTKNTCRVKIVICSESADYVRVRNLNKKSVLENIYNCYKLK